MRLRSSTVKRRTNCLLHWSYRDGFTRRGVPVTVDGIEGTFTRASIKTAVDSNGRVYTVPSGQPAMHYRYVATSGLWESGGALLEGQSQNVCLQSENFGTTWTLQNTPTRTAQAARCGSVYLDLIGDDSAASVEGYFQPITFTGDAVKAISFYVREGSSTSTQFALNDATATTNRLSGVITWSAGAPVVTMATGTHLLSERLQDVAGNRVTRVWCQTTSVTAANTNNLIFYPAQTAAGDVTLQGNVYIGGVQCENADTTVPSSYIPTTTVAVTRAADLLEFPALWLPKDLTMYVDMVDLGTMQLGSTVQGIIQLGDNDSGTTNTVHVFCDVTGDAQAVMYTTGLSQMTTGAVALGDQQELRIRALAAGLRTARSINGAAEVDGGVGSAVAHPTAYAEQVLCLTSLAPASFAAHAIRTVKIIAGDRTMAQCRTDF